MTFSEETRMTTDMIKFLRSWNTDPAHNLASEQILFETKKPEEIIIFLWQNNNTVVVGRYQNVFEEVNTAYAHSVNAKIVRRITGGGAVYHDLGNLNYSFIVENDGELKSCKTLLKNAFNKLGLNVKFEGRNDIFIDGYKISGCASCRENGKILYHGTLLVNSDLDVLERVLTRNNKIFSKSVKSNPKRVKNISSFISNINIETVIKAVCGGEKILEVADSHRTAELINNRYANDKWTYGFPPGYVYRNARHYGSGQVCVNADIQDGRIRDIKFSGDFIALRNIEELENSLINKVFSSSLKNFLDIHGNGFILGLQGSDIALLFENAIIKNNKNKYQEDKNAVNSLL